MKSSWSRGIAVLAALVLVFVFVLLTRERDGESAQLDAAAGAELKQQPLETTSDSTSSAQAPDNSVAREIAPETAPATTAPPPADTVLVRVVDCERFEPVAGAEVRWASWEWLTKDSSRYSLDSQRQFEGVLQSGLVSTSDEEGRVWIAKPSSALLVQATAPGLWGQVHLSPATSEPSEVVLAPDGDLLVEVLGEDGAPVAGVRVGARRATDSQSFESVTADTRADGVARLAHARARLLAGSATGTLVVSTEIADPKAPRAFVEVPPWPASPVQLRVGPTGAVVVNVVDEQGETFEQPTEVQLTVRVPEGPPSVLHGFARSGTVTFEHLPLGAQLSFFCFPRAEGRFSGSGTHAAGPTRAGERVLVAATVCKPEAMLRGRALDPQGVPLARAQLLLSVRVAAHLPPLESAEKTETDDEGRFRTTFPKSLGADVREPVLVARADERALEGVTPFRASVVAVDGDLGDIRLEPAPRLVSGRVLDENGAAIAGAHVGLFHFAPGAQASEFGAETAGMTVVEWELDTLRETRSDERGTFELAVREPRGRYALRATAPGFAAGPQVPFEAGAGAVELILRRTLDPLRGRVLAPTADSLVRLSIRAGLQAGLIDAFGRFTIPRRSPEPVDVVLRADGLGSEPLLTIAQVSDPRDPRLVTLDLRELVREFRFRVVGADGFPVRSVKVSGRARSGNGWQLESPALVCLLSNESTLDLELKADGHLPASFVGVRSGDVLTLERLPALLLRLPESLPAAGDGLVYVVQATRTDSKRQSIWIDSGRERRLQLPGPGQWTVLWTVRGTTKLLSQREVTVERDDVECVLDAKLGDVEAARAEVKAKRK